ncbi:MAG: tetratricopeptide repeat protein [Cyclobacteriaceae bacterium]|nr:tetratricopeptide repeat protein [Cyclobacteriaceae bacterium]
MNLTRIEQLLKFLEEDPNDVFSLYALALEYRDDDAAKATALLDKLLASQPGYLPAYYQAAILHQESGDIETAKKLFKEGISLAVQLKDNATQRELQAAYELLDD